MMLYWVWWEQRERGGERIVFGSAYSGPDLGAASAAWEKSRQDDYGSATEPNYRLSYMECRQPEIRRAKRFVMRGVQ